MRGILDTIATGGLPSPHLTPLLNAGVTPDIRAETKALVSRMKGFVFLACGTASPKDPYGAVSYCYYRTHAGPVVLNLGFGLAPDGRLAAASGEPE